MTYSREIDGLRAVSVLLVIFFHVDKTWLPGGFIGVDIFFVISGFLITGLLYKEINTTGRFSFANFYIRRFARLFPALIITLVGTFILGFMFYGSKQLDSLGKDIFFSALGIKNILDAGGENYFVKDVVYKPLLHMWSLGVEEQFYLVWPALLLLLSSFFKDKLFPILLALFVVSVMVSEYGAMSGTTGSYFMPQFRAFELLAGALTAIYLAKKNGPPPIPQTFRTMIVTGALGVLLALSFVFNDDTRFPGVIGLLVVIPAVVLIVYAHGTFVGNVLSHKVLVMIGLISYPLYLFHQPIISFTTLWDENLSPIVQLLLVLVVGSGLSYLTYKYAETPVRHRVKAGQGRVTVSALVAAIVALSALGWWTGKSSGFPSRLAVLNPYAHAIAEGLKPSFHANFKRGIHKAAAPEAKILLVGDSQLQQYVLPLAKHWGYELSQVDVISRGGCVLLKTADYVDSFADISCDDLRQEVYARTQKYDRIVISQAWHSYAGEITNLSQVNDDHYTATEWASLLRPTIEHFLPLTDQITVIGPHPAAISTCGKFLAPMVNVDAINACLATTKMKYDEVTQKDQEFAKAMVGLDANLLLLGSVWCDDRTQTCNVNDPEGIPFFRDRRHFGNVADTYLIEKFGEMGL